MDLLQGYGDDNTSEQPQNKNLKPVLLKSKINSAPDVDITDPVLFNYFYFIFSLINNIQMLDKVQFLQITHMMKLLLQFKYLFIL